MAVEYHDMPAVRHIVDTAADSEYRFSDLIVGIIESVPFGMKQVPEEEAGLRVGANDTTH